MDLLFLRLEAPLMSWGDHSKWDPRDSAPMPTKSGVLGMIGCCMGLKRGDSKHESLHKGLKMGIRVDQRGQIMTDFHTVQGMCHGLMNAEGAKRSVGNTILSPRQYIEDASFLVALQGSAPLLTQCHSALLDPVWPPYLGRKSCPPSAPICLERNDRYSSLEDALRKYPSSERAANSGIAYIEDPHGEIVRIDQLTNAANRVFASRRQRVVTFGADVEVSL